MATTQKQKIKITVKTTINFPIDKVWSFWNDPFHIMHWYYASEDWQTTWVENNLKMGGKFLFRLEAKDGSAGFDFTGKYNTIVYHKLINFTLDDGRSAIVTFISDKYETTIKEIFEAEDMNLVELQKTGWQSILNNFKKYIENAGVFEKLHFKVNIRANVSDVYKILIDKKFFSKWTNEFNPTSRYEGIWEKGSKIRFLGEDDNGLTGGIVSRIKENIRDKFISIEHQGIIQRGEEIINDPQVKGWAGALENYSLIDKNGNTLLIVDMDTNYDVKSYMENTWPKALKKLKEICEIK